MLGAIEAGGTKFVCAVATDDGTIVDKTQFPTTDPSTTIEKTIDYFKGFDDLTAIGISSFGPIDVNENSETYGYVTNTPKTEWVNFDFLGSIERAFPEAKVVWTTDVIGAGFGEHTKGAGVGLKSCLYLTIGTGVGGGIVYNGQPMQGIRHPEMGHIIMDSRETDPEFKGICPFHDNCFEGLTCGPAIEARYGMKADKIPTDDPIWETIGDYIAQAINVFTLTSAPDIVVVGGGVSKQAQLFPIIRKKFLEYNNGYMKVEDVDKYIVPTGLGDDSGIVGSIELARKALSLN